MTFSSILGLLIAAGLVLWIGIRQLFWSSLSARSPWLVPGILVLLGVVMLAREPRLGAVTPVDIALLAGEIALGGAIGAALGLITRVRPVGEPRLDRRGREIRWETRTSWIGLVLWFGLIGMRVGIDIWAQGAGAGELVVSTGAILLVVGGSRLSRALVLDQRIARGHALVA